MMGEAAALGSAAFWALSTISIKGVSGRMSAFLIMALRTAVAAALLLVAVLIVSPSSFDFGISPGILAILLGSALLATFGDVAFVRAIAIEDVSRVFTVSTSLYILVSVAGSVLFAGEPFSWLLVLAGVAILAGSRFVLSESNAGEGVSRQLAPRRDPLAAVGLSILASVLWSVSLLAVSDALDSVNPVTAAVLRLPVMAVALVGVAFSRGSLRPGALNLNDAGTLCVSGALVLGSMLLFLTAAGSASAGSVAVLTSTSPIFAVPLSYLLLREQVTLRVVGGTALCMTGIWVMFV